MIETCRHVLSLFPRILVRSFLTCCCLAGATIAQADRSMNEFGTAGAPAITLLAPAIPTVIDSRGQLRPGVAQWMAHIAGDSGVQIHARTANVDRSEADMARDSQICVLGYARLPSRENHVQWLAALHRDKIMLIARRDDPFQGTLLDAMNINDSTVAAPKGIYLSDKKANDTRFVTVSDQRRLARMVEAGRVRFGVLIGITLEVPEIRNMEIRVVGQLPPQEFWFACNRDLPDGITRRLARALQSPVAGQLLRTVLANPPPASAP